MLLVIYWVPLLDYYYLNASYGKLIISVEEEEAFLLSVTRKYVVSVRRDFRCLVKRRGRAI